MKNILITGGAGFIGSNLALKLLKKGYQVTILDCLSKQIHGDNPEVTSPLFKSIFGLRGINFIHGTVTSRENLKNAILGQDAVIHLAAETGTGQSMYEIESYSNTNFHGTSILLDILANEDHQIKKLIVASSRAIYGEGKYRCEKHGLVYPSHRSEDDMKNKDFECKCPFCGNPVVLLPTCEASKIHPSSVYGITKHTQEELVLTVGKSLNIPSVAFRYQNVYGPGQSLSNPYTGILSIFSTQIKNGNDINIFEDGLESRDFVFIDDVVNATILGLEKKEANYQVFNVGADLPISVIDVAEMLIKNYSSNVKYDITGNFRLGDIRHNYADLTKIKSLLNYKPEYSFEKGLNLFCNWVNTQEVKVDRYNDSIIEMREKGLFK